MLDAVRIVIELKKVKADHAADGLKVRQHNQAPIVGSSSPWMINPWMMFARVR